MPAREPEADVVATIAPPVQTDGESGHMRGPARDERRIMAEEDNQQQRERHAHGYDRILQRAREYLDEFEEHAGDAVATAVDRAKERSHELGELSREEAERIGEYVRRDMSDAAAWMEESGQEFGQWLRFDLEQVEQRLMENFLKVADRTRVELSDWAERANRFGEWHTGEITSVGTLRCEGCGEELHFTRTAHIPPCPRCHGTVFKRVYAGE